MTSSSSSYRTRLSTTPNCRMRPAKGSSTVYRSSPVRRTTASFSSHRTRANRGWKTVTLTPGKDGHVYTPGGCVALVRSVTNAVAINTHLMRLLCTQQFN